MVPNWNEAVSHFPLAHFLQTVEWANVKQSIGWLPDFLCWDHRGQLFNPLKETPVETEISAAALVLERKINFGGLNTGLSMLYIPKGPVFNWLEDSGQAILEQIQNYARKTRVIFLKIDPDVILGTGIEGIDSEVNIQGEAFRSRLRAAGWRFSLDQIQFRNTIHVQLEPGADDLLSSMKSKTRYNIRLAEKKGVNVRIGSIQDLPGLYAMYAETAFRDNFILREREYYLRVWGSFMDNQMAEPLIAEVEGVPIAAVMVFRFAGKAWYVYGMSRDIHREKMPNYLLQWRAILRAKETGCSVYDFWGAPNQFLENDPLWGVYRFKDGFGGQVVRTIGAWDFVVKPNLYQFSMILLPKLLDLLRRKARRKLKAVVQA